MAQALQPEQNKGEQSDCWEDKGNEEDKNPRPKTKITLQEISPVPTANGTKKRKVK